MHPATFRIALAKQRAINRHLRQQLRAETMLTNALSDLAWLPSQQTPAKIKRVRDALALKESLAAGAAPQSFYPVTARQAA